MMEDVEAIVRYSDARRETKAVWRCAIGDVTGALDVLKNEWVNSKRKHERDAGAKLSAVLDLIWAARSPAGGDYEEAAKNGKVMIERVRTYLLSQTKE